MRLGHAAARVDRQKLAAQGVPVDSRIGRGRTARDALRKLLEAEELRQDHRLRR